MGSREGRGEEGGEEGGARSVDAPIRTGTGGDPGCLVFACQSGCLYRGLDQECGERAMDRCVQIIARCVWRRGCPVRRPKVGNRARDRGVRKEDERSATMQHIYI
jgi:hypothetical protein